MLPGLDGLSVLARMRRAGSDAPVILLTARGDVRDRVRGLDAGADDYLAKPFHVEELLARVRAVLRRRGAPDPWIANIRAAADEMASKVAGLLGAVREGAPRDGA